MPSALISPFGFDPNVYWNKVSSVAKQLLAQTMLSYQWQPNAAKVKCTSKNKIFKLVAIKSCDNIDPHAIPVMRHHVCGRPEYVNKQRRTFTFPQEALRHPSIV